MQVCHTHPRDMLEIQSIIEKYFTNGKNKKEVLSQHSRCTCKQNKHDCKGFSPPRSPWTPPTCFRCQPWPWPSAVVPLCGWGSGYSPHPRHELSHFLELVGPSPFLYSGEIVLSSVTASHRSRSIKYRNDARKGEFFFSDLNPPSHLSVQGLKGYMSWNSTQLHLSTINQTM